MFTLIIFDSTFFVFLKTLSNISGVDIIGIMDVNSDAPGLIFASEHIMPALTDLASLMQQGMDMLLELTGHDGVLEDTSIRSITAGWR